MSFSTSDSWCVQSLSTCLLGACRFAGLKPLEVPPHIRWSHWAARQLWQCRSSTKGGVTAVLQAGVEPFVGIWLGGVHWILSCVGSPESGGEVDRSQTCGLDMWSGEAVVGKREGFACAPYVGVYTVLGAVWPLLVWWCAGLNVRLLVGCGWNPLQPCRTFAGAQSTVR